MTDALKRDPNDELTRLRRLRDTTLAILRRPGSTREEKLEAIERAFEIDLSTAREPDEDAEAEEARDRERLS